MRSYIKLAKLSAMQMTRKIVCRSQKGQTVSGLGRERKQVRNNGDKTRLCDTKSKYAGTDGAKVVPLKTGQTKGI